MSAPVLLDVRQQGRYRVAVATLNNPRALNALSLPMIEQLLPALRQWAADPDIAAVLLHGAGERAFCAGGDIVAVYRALAADAANGGQVGVTECDRLFTLEYQLDALLHRYPKPVLAWGEGLVMGGGWGLFAGVSHRVLTPGSHLAMPEIGIGLFPDVGACHFLNRLPAWLGRAIALTGLQLNSQDALDLGLADLVLPASERQRVFDGFAQLPWRGDAAQDSALLQQWLAERACALGALPPAEVLPRWQLLRALFDQPSLLQIDATLRELAAGDIGDDWLQAATRTYAGGSPTTAAITWQALGQARTQGLDGVFAQDLRLARQCLRHPDFKEGIRALLIDKDKQPSWTPARLQDISAEWLAAHFAEVAAPTPAAEAASEGDLLW